MCDADLIATQPQPLDLAKIRLRWADADEFSGTMRWNPIVAELVAEVERLRHEVADLEMDLREALR